MAEAEKKILIVDDEPRNLKILHKRLDPFYDLVEASSGEEALKLIDEGLVPGLVVLDIMMPGIDGYQVAAKLRENPRIKLTKIILVSGKAMIDEKLKGYEAGADDYVTKPFEGDEIRAKVKVFMRLYQLEKQLESVNEGLELEIKARAEQLMKSERLAFLGLHSSQIVHNLNGPLHALRLLLYLARDQQSELPQFAAMEKQIDKLASIVVGILKQVKVNYRDEMRQIDVERLINDELDLIKIDSLFAKECQIKVEMGHTQTLMMVPIHLSQVLGNLIKNAKEAMTDTEFKALTIRTEDAGDQLKFTIEDSGLGIPDELKQRIFEPLFSTKGERGTGLGLAYCRKMIESYGGTLQVESQPNKGTVFILTLPFQPFASKSFAA